MNYIRAHSVICQILQHVPKLFSFAYIHPCVLKHVCLPNKVLIYLGRQNQEILKTCQYICSTDLINEKGKHTQ